MRIWLRVSHRRRHVCVCGMKGNMLLLMILLQLQLPFLSFSECAVQNGALIIVIDSMIEWRNEWIYLHFVCILSCCLFLSALLLSNISIVAIVVLHTKCIDMCCCCYCVVVVFDKCSQSPSLDDDDDCLKIKPNKGSFNRDFEKWKWQ